MRDNVGTGVDAAVQTPTAGIEEIYPLEQLQKECPAGVAAHKKQDYLSPEDFQKTFGMDKDAFYELKDWKQKDLRKEVGLF